MKNFKTSEDFDILGFDTKTIKHLQEDDNITIKHLLEEQNRIILSFMKVQE